MTVFLKLMFDEKTSSLTWRVFSEIITNYYFYMLFKVYNFLWECDSDTLFCYIGVSIMVCLRFSRIIWGVVCGYLVCGHVCTSICLVLVLRQAIYLSGEVFYFTPHSDSTENFLDQDCLLLICSICRHWKCSTFVRKHHRIKQCTSMYQIPRRMSKTRLIYKCAFIDKSSSLNEEIKSKLKAGN